APGGRSMMQKTGWMLALLATGSLGLQGCHAFMGAASHSPYETVHDDQLTYDDFEGVMDWDAPDDQPIADGIVPVHELDEGAVQQGGGVKVVDGHTWLFAGDFERNRRLL